MRLRGYTMNIRLPLTFAEEQKLLAEAQAQGIPPEVLVRRAIEPMIAAVPGDLPEGKKPKKSMLGMLAKYGPAPSAEDIDENRKEMFASFVNALAGCGKRISHR